MQNIKTAAASLAAALFVLTAALFFRLCGRAGLRWEDAP